MVEGEAEVEEEHLPAERVARLLKVPFWKVERDAEELAEQLKETRLLLKAAEVEGRLLGVLEEPFWPSAELKEGS